MPADPTRTSPPGEVPTASHVPGADTAPGGPLAPTGSHAPPADTVRDAAHPTPPEMPPRLSSVSGYEILGELGRGGMGVVYKARDTALNRTVALKMVLGPDASPARTLVRFLAEAEAVAAVRHPHVVQVYEYGEHSGRPFMALEYLPSGSLAERLAAGAEPGKPARLDPAAAVDLVRKIAAGVAAAHEAGIVHRDLKPGNVLFDEAGDPKVTDFGLAKRVTGADLTQTGAILGTPQYMAPEQAAGETKFVGPQADVWALGAILYECLTGRRPFQADSVSELLFRIRTADPPSLRTHAPGVPRDFDVVCAKCLEKNPADRYPTAAELADDLDRLHRGEPISIRPAGLLERTYKWARRKPTVAALYALTAVAAVLGVFGAVVAGFWRDADAAHRKADDAFRQADAERGAAVAARDDLAGANKQLDVSNRKIDETNKQLEAANEKIEFGNYAANLDLATVAYRTADLFRANALLDECASRFRGWEWWYLRRLCNQHLAAYEVEGFVEAMTADRRLLVVRTQTGTNLVDVRTGRVVFGVAHARTYNDTIVVSADGTRLAVEGPNQTVRVFDVAAGKELLSPPDPVVWPAVALSPDGTRLAAIDKKDGVLRVCDAANGRVLHRLVVEPDARANHALYSPDGKWLLSHTADGRLRVWDAATGAAIADAPAPGGKPLPPQAKVAFVGRGDRFVIDPGDTPVRVYDTAGCREIAKLAGTNEGGGIVDGGPGVMRLATSPDGKWIATGHQGTVVRVWEAETGKLVSTSKPPEGLNLPHVLRSLEFSPDSAQVVTTDVLATPSVVRNRVRLWDPMTGRLVHHLPADALAQRAWFTSADRVITSHLRGGVFVWDAAASRAHTAVSAPPGGAFADTPLSKDGRRIVGVDKAGATLLWDVATGKPITDPAELAAAGPARRPVPRSGFRVEFKLGVALILGPANRLVAVMPRPVGAKAVAVSPDGSRILVLSADGAARVCAVPSGDELVRFEHPGPLASVAFTRDGRHVVANPRAFEAVVFDATTGRRLLTIRDTTQLGGVDSLVMAPDGRRAAVTHQEGPVRIWDTKTDKLLFDGPGVVGAAVGFTPDGRRLVISGYQLYILDSAPVGAVDDWKP